MGSSESPAESSHIRQLLDRAAQFDQDAVEQLMNLHRDRLRRMVYIYLDPCVTPRADASDVVQETMMEASRRLPDYLRERPAAFYPWLRGIARQRLLAIEDRHLRAAKRTVYRETPSQLRLSDQSVAELAQRVIAPGSTSSQHAMRDEAKRKVRQALSQLGSRDRELLSLRFLEQLSLAETAEILGMSQAAVRTAQLRALERFKILLDELSDSDELP